MENLIKMALAILFYICLLDMPYGYYELVRFLAMIGFVFLAYKSFERKEKGIMIVYGGLAILFQPLIKIALGREIWNIVDVIVGLGLIAAIFIKPRTEKN